MWTAVMRRVNLNSCTSCLNCASDTRMKVGVRAASRGAGDGLPWRLAVLGISAMNGLNTSVAIAIVQCGCEDYFWSIFLDLIFMNDASIH